MFTFQLTFPNPIIAVEFNSDVNNIEFGLEYFKYSTLIQLDFIYTESIFFWLYGFEPFVFNIGFMIVSFFIPAENQLFSF